MEVRFLLRLFAIALAGSLTLGFPAASQAESDSDIASLVTEQVKAELLSSGPGGAAVAVHVDGRTLFFNYGMADRARPVTSDVLFNLGSVGKIFDTSLLTLADQRGELSLDDSIAKHVPELQQGGDIRRITLRQLATHTSGLVLAQDHPPWPEQAFTLPEFLATLNAWTADKDHEPGKQMIYSHAGFILLHLALERRVRASV